MRCGCAEVGDFGLTEVDRLRLRGGCEPQSNRQPQPQPDRDSQPWYNRSWPKPSQPQSANYPPTSVGRTTPEPKSPTSVQPQSPVVGEPRIETMAQPQSPGVGEPRSSTTAELAPATMVL